jgi:hypothetical protein
LPFLARWSSDILVQLGRTPGGEGLLPKQTMTSNKLSVELTFVEALLGSQCANPVVKEEQLKKQAVSDEKIQEEMSMIPPEEAFEKQTTVFHRNQSGLVILDYQIKGFFKESIGVMVELGDVKGMSKWTFKRAVDKLLFVSPRLVHIKRDGVNVEKPDSIFQRPLRGETMRGERVCLAASERIEPGVTVSFTVQWLSGTNEKSKMALITEKLIKDCLDYGAVSGFGQWRNGGFGRFTWVSNEQ